MRDSVMADIQEILKDVHRSCVDIATGSKLDCLTFLIHFEKY